MKPCVSNASETWPTQRNVSLSKVFPSGGGVSATMLDRWHHVINLWQLILPLQSSDRFARIHETQCSGMCRHKKKKNLIEWGLELLMNRNIWWGGHRWPSWECQQCLFSPSHEPNKPQIIFTFYNMTLRDDGRRGGQEWSGWYDGQTWQNDSHSHVTCMSFVLEFLSDCVSESLSKDESVTEEDH